MAKQEFSFQSHDNTKIVCFKHTPDNTPKAVLIITHGMMEYGERYDNFAEFLNRNDIMVYAYDERGHGKTAGNIENLGFIANKDGWQKVTDDINELVKIARNDAPNIPVFLHGQSYGSFLVRNYLIQYSENVNGAVITATGGSAGILSIMGIAITEIMMLFKKKNSLSPFLDKMIFGSYNKEFKPARTKFDWLSRDEKIVDQYIDDPFCGGVCSVKFYNDLAKGVEKVNKKKNAQLIRKDLPIIFLSGEKDPLSKNSKQIPVVLKMYKDAGLTDVEMKIYPEARHEIINEINKEEVYNDILNWIKKRMA